jgi:hypothetical protein
MQYPKPSRGRQFNVVNCTRYIKSLLHSLTGDIDSLSDQSDLTIQNMDDFHTISIHVAFLTRFYNTIGPILETLKTKHAGVQEKFKELLASVPDCPSTDWEDITQYEELCTAVRSGSSGSMTEIMTHQQHRDNPGATASKVLECIPDKLNVEGLYSYELDGAKWTIPRIRSLEDIPPMFYYFEGDEMHKRGVYICISPGIYVQVPQVRVIPETASNSKHRTAPCKDGLECKKVECTFAHPGTELMKLGIASRCPSNPRFGDKDSYGEDMGTISESDIRMLLLYSLSDIFPATSWLQANQDPLIGTMNVIDNLELCEPKRSERL